MVKASITFHSTEKRGAAGLGIAAAASNEAPHLPEIPKNSNTTKLVVFAPAQRRTIPVFTRLEGRDVSTRETT